MLENACVVVASMVADFKNVTCEELCKVWHHLLSLDVDAIKGATKRLKQVVLQLLCTLQFKVTHSDSLWEQCCSPLVNESHFSHVLQGLAHWPDGKRTLSEFLTAVLTSAENKETFPKRWFEDIHFPDGTSNFAELAQDWLYPPFLDTLQKLQYEEPPMTTTTASSLTPGAQLVLEYQKTFGICHPFLIPFDASKMAGISRSDFEAGVDAYVSFCTHIIPQKCVDHLACVTCCSDRELQQCTRCQGWVLCVECFSSQEGYCAQCFSSEQQMQSWVVRTGSKLIR
jgi:hypothetical protein